MSSRGSAVLRTALSAFATAALLTGCAEDTAAVACAPDADPSDSFVRALTLGSIDDSGDATLTHEETLSACNPDDYFRFHVDDTSLVDKNDLEVTAKPYGSSPSADAGSAGTIELCVYVGCDDGATDLSSCSADGVALTTVVSSDGFVGCCREGGGGLSVGYVCDNGISSITSEDDADVFVHVCLHGGTDRSYGVSAHF